MDFTDRGHKLGPVVDLRVLLPDTAVVGGQNLVPGKKESMFDPSAASNENPLEHVDPTRLAWLRVGPHWVLNLFQRGNLWLVNTAGMGSHQQQMVGLTVHPPQQASSAAAGDSGAAGAAATADAHACGDGDGDGDDYSDDKVDEDR
jgi:hypothetical protein